MTRSIKLGHCVCNVQQGCPCDIFKNQNICPCAGEKLPPVGGPVPLTRYVKKAGCASKIGQADLKRILGKLPPVTDPNVILGAAAGDDAGIYRLDDRHSLVQTVDVFTPCVDDAYLFGQIAAANSLSDVYAMGGRPLTALSIVGFPIDDLDGGILEAMLRGGLDKLNEAGCSLIGGHSLIDEEIKCGFAITGLIETSRTVTRDCARPGDVLVQTKPLGTGMISFAAQLGRISPECLNETGASMATLNQDAAELMVQWGAHACTDVTGFGLAGHLVEMARNSGVSVELDLSALPVFATAAECLENEVLSGAVERNQEYAMAWVRVADSAHEQNLPILYDPQTSGGLLISLPEDAAKQLIAAMHSRGHRATSMIGRVKARETGQAEGGVIVINTRLMNLVGRRGALRSAAVESSPLKTVSREMPMNTNQEETRCCDGAGAAAIDAAVATPDRYQNFLKQANQPGLIDARSKKLIAIALSVAQRCEPCLQSHLKSARAMGITPAEIDEAAWLAIAFAGSPAMMLYREASREIL